VLALPNAHRDVDGTGERPALTVRGCPARVVVLTHGGTPLVDQLVVDAAAVAVPQGAERIVVAPLGDGVPTPSLAGWHGGQTLAYVGWDTALATDASVHVDGTTVARRDDRYRAGWTEAAELVDGSATVTTRFTRPVDVVLVVVDDPSAEVGRRLLLGLDGATQVAGDDGAPLPPTVLVSGNRTFLAYRVVRAGDAAVAVTIASGTGWHLVGVLGGSGDPADLVGALAARGFDAALGTAACGPGQVDVRWQAAPVVKAAPRRRTTAKKTAAKKTTAKKTAAKKTAAKKTTRGR
jgi:hypothetical protein